MKRKMTVSLENLTYEELELLEEGLEAIMKSESMSKLNTALLGAMMSDSREEAEDRFDEAMEEDTEMMEKKEDILILQAKITKKKKELRSKGIGSFGQTEE